MIPTIPPSAYFDEDVFQKEHEKIFQHYWQFIGFRSDLDNHRDYITGNIGKKNIIAQNFNGELKAFHNVCSHRYCRIHQEEKGNRPLKCPYHGWTYNSNGSLVGVPFKSDFSELKGNNWQEHFRLEEWEIDNCGQFVFVKTKKNKVSLKKFLGSYFT